MRSRTFRLGSSLGLAVLGGFLLLDAPIDFRGASVATMGFIAAGFGAARLLASVCRSPGGPP
jgi:hypothetical protein